MTDEPNYVDMEVSAKIRMDVKTKTQLKFVCECKGELFRLQSETCGLDMRMFIVCACCGKEQEIARGTS